MTVHGVLRHVLADEVARLARAIENDLRSPRNAPDAPRGFPDSKDAINPGLLLHRLWLGADRSEVQTALREAHLRAVATACRKLPGDLLDAVHARRAAAAAALAARNPQWTWHALLITPMWRLVVGHGEDSVHETGLTLSPTYGVPVVPAAALKGLAAAAARETGWSDLDTTLFGAPRPGQGSAADRGSVVIWDGLPIEPPTLVLDVLTPHVKDYYEDSKSPRRVAPAEYHSPVPIRFLAVEKTSFRCYLIGSPADVTRCAELINIGLDELGIGGKTAAGYGYCAPPEEELS
ncbi:MAG: type III-B CRISPR module RAMP protein Cmr6 [Pseudonocardiaceae bacterium]